VAEAHLSKIIKVDLKSDLFTYGIDAKVLESEIEIAPVLHRQPEQIRAHASICFMALILYRVMRQRLKAAAGHAASPETALAQLRRIQRQRVSINQVPIIGNSTITHE
jgi:transposase